MQPSGAAERYQCELSRIVTALNRNHANGFLHGSVDHANNPGCKLFEREFATLLLQPRRHNPTSAFQIEREVAAKKTMRLQSSQDQIRIRDRRLIAATVANWTRVSSADSGPTRSAPAGSNRAMEPPPAPTV